MDDILAEVLGHIHLVRDDKQKLQKILDFILTEIYEEPEEKTLEIPEKYEKLLDPIAQSIDAGFVCFLNPDTLEIEEVPQKLLEDPDDYEMITGCGLDDMDLKHAMWEKCYTFEPLESYESFKIMEGFAGYIDDPVLQNKLFNALNRRHPFRNFNGVIHNSTFRESWFQFKQEWLENHVKQIIWAEENKITDDVPEHYNGLYDDNGNKIDPESVPVPSLCTICKKHQADDWEENILCLLNRHDQRNDDDFKCGMFEKI